MQNDDQPIRIKLRGTKTSPARSWVSKQYSTHKTNPLNPQQLVFNYGNAVTLVELVPDIDDEDVVWIKWIQSTPQQTGAATKTIQMLQQDAEEADIALKLDIFQTGPVDPNILKQIYGKLGFVDDEDGMIWYAGLNEAWSNKYKKSINCSNPKGFSQKAHCAARRKRQAGGKTTSKPVHEQILAEVITAYHGSGKADIRSKRFWPLTHFGTEKAARDRMTTVGYNHPNEYRIYQVELNINNPAMIKDEDVTHDPTQFAFALNKAKIFSKLEMMTVTVWPTIKSTSYEDYEAANEEAKKHHREKQKQVATRQLIKLLKSKGYDGMVYKNKHEDKGSLSYVILDPSQARIVRSRRIDEDWTLEEANRGEFSTVFRNRSNEEGGHRFELTADEFVEHIDKLLSSGYDTEQAIIELATVYTRHPHKIKNWPELTAMLDKHKAELMRVIKYHYTKEPYLHALLRSAIVSSALIAAGVAWPELRSLLDTNKEKVVKGLLILIKDDADDYAMNYLRCLRDVHVHWPELTAIHKSLSKDIQSLNESKLPELDALLPTIDTHIARSIKLDVDKMRRDMNENNSGYRPILVFLRDISVYALTIGKPKLVEVVNATKPLMLKHIEWVLSTYSKPFVDLTMTDPLYQTLKSIAQLKNRVGVDWPELDSILNTYKDAIIKTCLKQIRYANAYSMEDLNDLVTQLTDIGVDWPEFATIKKSLGDDLLETRELSANDFSDPDDHRRSTMARMATRLIDRMHMGYSNAVINAIGDLRTYSLDDPETLKAIFEAIKPELLNYIRYSITKSTDTDIINTPSDWFVTALTSALTVKHAAKWSEINDILEENKTNIIRNILMRIKSSPHRTEAYEMSSAVDLLDYLGCNWPELAIIQNSLKKAKYTLREDDLDPIFKQIDAESAKLTINQQLGLAKLRSLLSRGKLFDGSMHAFMVHLNYLKLNDAQKARVYPQLDQDFAAFITRRIKKKEMRMVLNVFGALVLNGIDCPNVVAVVNKHKPVVLKELLNSIRSHYDQVSKLVVEIVDNKILDWPELEIIMKSIRSSQLKETELLDKPTPTIEELAAKHNCTPQDVLIELRKGVAIEKEHTNRLDLAREIAMDHLNEDLYYYEKLAKVERTDESNEIDVDGLLKFGISPTLDVLGTMRKNAKSSGTSEEEFDAILARIKPHVIKRALEHVRNRSVYEAGRIVYLARDLGADWPELNTISNAIVAIRRER